MYGLGYQQGIIDYSRDPEQKQDDLLMSILAGVGCIDRSRMKTAREGDWRNRFLRDEDVQMRQVALVGEKIIQVAKKYVDEEFGKVMAEKISELPDDVREREGEDGLSQLLLSDEELSFWAAAKQRMDGQWRYCLIDTPVDNAFVSEILPQRIFVTTAMINNYIHSDDEMALILGHEVSHLILGHVSDGNSLGFMLRTLEVLCLALDPTEGLMSLGVMAALATVRKSLVMAQSRENETAADELGIKIAAMACYDTRKAAHIFHKMHLNETESGAENAEEEQASRSLSSLLRFADSHPPSNERHLNLVKASKEENAERYQNTHCSSVRNMFRDMLSSVRRGKAENGKEGPDITGGTVVSGAGDGKVRLAGASMA